MIHHNIPPLEFEFLLEFQRPYQALLSKLANELCENFVPVKIAPDIRGGGVIVNGHEISVMPKCVGAYYGMRPVHDVNKQAPMDAEKATAVAMETIADMFLERGPGIFAGIGLLEGPELTGLFQGRSAPFLLCPNAPLERPGL